MSAAKCACEPMDISAWLRGLGLERDPHPPVSIGCRSKNFPSPSKSAAIFKGRYIPVLGRPMAVRPAPMNAKNRFRIDELRPDIPDKASQRDSRRTNTDYKSPIGCRHFVFAFSPITTSQGMRPTKRDGTGTAIAYPTGRGNDA